MNRIFFDMDGTLNNITKALLDDNGKVQIEKIYKNKGFYEKIEPENNMIETLRQLFEKTDYEIYIISACELGDPPGFEQQKDNWLDKNKIPVPLSNRIYVGFDERKTDCIPGGIQNGDILIDDYNKNLEEWESEGISKGVKALGIKVCTDYNDTGKGFCGGEENKRWVGERVATKKSPEQNISAIENAINKINSPEQYNMQTVDKSIYEIKYLKDCFGGHSYFGYKYGEQYTDGYDSKYELIEDNPEFKTLLNKNKSDEFEQMYIDSISSVCLSIVAEIKISDNNTAAILKEYDEERPIYYLSDDYQIRGSTIDVNSKGSPINTLEEAEQIFVDSSLRLYEPQQNTEKILSDEYDKWFACSGSYRPLHKQLISYFDEDKLIELIQNSRIHSKIKYLDEYLATDGFKDVLNKVDIIQNIESTIGNAQVSDDKIQFIEVLDSKEKGCFDVVAKYKIGRQCLMTKPNKRLANNLADDISKRFNISRSADKKTHLNVQNNNQNHYRR